MSNETPAEVIAAMRKESENPGFGDETDMGYNSACRYWADRLDRSLAAGKVATDGYVLVPREPTEAMIEAAWESDAADYVGEHKRIHNVGDAWAAMIEAAPPADPAKASKPDDFLLRAAREVLSTELGEMACVESHAPAENALGLLALAVAQYPEGPAKASEPEYDRSLIADMLEDCHMRGHVIHGDAVEEQIRLLRASDNADKVRTVRASGSAPDDEDPEGEDGPWSPGWDERSRPTPEPFADGRLQALIDHHETWIASAKESGFADAVTFHMDCLAVIRNLTSPPASAPDGCGACGNGCNGGPCRVLQDSPPASAPVECARKGTGRHCLAPACMCSDAMDRQAASAPEVTESMVTGLLREYLRREPSEEGIVELDDTVSREFARGLLTAALKEPRHD